MISSGAEAPHESNESWLRHSSRSYLFIATTKLVWRALASGTAIEAIRVLVVDLLSDSKQVMLTCTGEELD